MIFCFLYKKQIFEIEAESVVHAIIEIMKYDFYIDNNKNDFEILYMKDAS